MSSISSIAQNANSRLNDSGLKPYLLPAAAGAALGGPLMAYFAAKNKRDGETPSGRRHRILRNAILGTTLGGVAGGAIPAGISTLAEQAEPMSGFHPVDAAANSAVKHWAPTLTGLAGATVGFHHLSGNRQQAAENIANVLSHETAPTRAGVSNSMEDALMAKAHSPEGQSGIIAQLAAKLNGGKDPGPGTAAGWMARERLNEAGVSTAPISAFAPADQATEIEGLKTHLGQQGPISRLAGKSVDALGALRGKLTAPGAPAVGAWLAKNVMPADHRLAELYSSYARPSVSSGLGHKGLRVGLVPMSLGIGGAMLGANYAQQKLQGN